MPADPSLQGVSVRRLYIKRARGRGEQVATRLSGDRTTDTCLMVNNNSRSPRVAGRILRERRGRFYRGCGHLKRKIERCNSWNYCWVPGRKYRRHPRALDTMRHLIITGNSRKNIQPWCRPDWASIVSFDWVWTSQPISLEKTWGWYRLCKRTFRAGRRGMFVESPSFSLEQLLCGADYQPWRSVKLRSTSRRVSRWIFNLKSNAIIPFFEIAAGSCSTVIYEILIEKCIFRTPVMMYEV